MTTTRNRGKHSNDDKLFSAKWYPKFKAAADDLGFLLSRGYGENSSLQLVGNRYRLNKRQRNAISRISCSEQQIAGRNKSECSIAELGDQVVEIDGFNLLILLESALSGGYIFKGRDGLYRDISSVHGSYKRVVKTEEAITIIGDCLKTFKVKFVRWYLDQPVSNSGRLKTKLLELSRENQFNWEVELVFDPDKVLAKSSNIVISSDGWILDNVKRWFNLGAFIIEKNNKKFNMITV
ncbi:MAG: DUF434 domain-containing protein [Bacteroidota bacterium]